MGESIFVYFEDYSQSLLPQRKNKIWILKKHVVFFHRFESERERVREREKGYRCLSIIFAINTHQCVVFFVWAIGSKIVISTWEEKLRTSWQFYSKRVFFCSFCYLYPCYSAYAFFLFSSFDFDSSVITRCFFLLLLLFLYASNVKNNNNNNNNNNDNVFRT